MSDNKVYRAIGLMSGTSLDGIDAALIETDGAGYVKPLKFITKAYDDDLRAALRACFGKKEGWDAAAERDMTLAHASLVKELGEKADIIGFHGQTIFHVPEEGITVQIGDGALLAEETGMDVVCDFRSEDVKAGGQGAPLAPLYHKALIQSQKLSLPVAVLNIGGVANVTYIGQDGILAFDTGPGNALMDDFILKRTGARFDEGGMLAAQGKVDEGILHNAISLGYFQRVPPKALDRDEWGDVLEAVEALSTEDGVATLLAFTGESILKALDHMPMPPKTWHVCGGGRHNKALMAYLSAKLNIAPVENLGWNGDAIEAECFAYLAVRSLLNLPLTLPSTTGVPHSLTGGVLHSL